MNEARPAKEFKGFEYREISVSGETASFYVDCYENFGWIVDENLPQKSGKQKTLLRLKRNRKIINKMELTRLQRHFEACAGELSSLDKSKTSAAMITALSVGILGTAFMAGSTFAVTNEPPIIWLCVLLAIPGFLGWILPYFLFGHIKRKQAQKLQPLIEAKIEEIYEICEKGHALL